MKVLPPEEFSVGQMSSYLKKHFFLEENPHEIGYGRLAIDIHISPTHPWITPKLVEIIKEHIQKKYQFEEVDVILDSENIF